VNTAHPHIYTTGTLKYNRPQLFALFFWLLWGDFCFMIMENVVPSVLPLKFKELGASNFSVGLILTTIPMILNMSINPFMSTKSDRFRSRWGRRIPFLVIFMPFVVLSLIGLGFADHWGLGFHRHFASFLHNASPNTVALIFIAIMIVIFNVFNILGTVTYWYLFNDVVPEHFLGRFMAWFRMVSMASVSLYNYFIFKYAGTHYREIFIGAGILYTVGFLMMCFKVKEGEYPPPPPYEHGHSGLKAAIKTYGLECWGMKHYWLVFLTSIFGSVAYSYTTFLIYLYQATGMNLEQIGKIAGLANMATAVVMLFTGWLADRFHPIRIVIIGVLLEILVVAPASMVWFFWHPGPQMTFYFWLVIMVGLNAPAYALVTMCDPPMFMRVFPRERYGQFCSANALLRSFALILSGMATGYFLDKLKDRFGEQFAYFCLPIWPLIFYSGMLVVMILLYRSWKRYGGDESYVPPDPLTPELRTRT
jgi:maltose/moltooligosaccharide transporter